MSDSNGECNLSELYDMLSNYSEKQGMSWNTLLFELNLMQEPNQRAILASDCSTWEKPKDLSEIEFRMVKFYYQSQLVNGFPPSLRDICSEFNYSSTNSPYRKLRALERKNYLIPKESNSAKYKKYKVNIEKFI